MGNKGMFQFDHLTQMDRVVLVKSIVNANRYLLSEVERDRWVREYVDNRFERTVKTSEDFMNRFFDYLNSK